MPSRRFGKLRIIIMVTIFWISLCGFTGLGLAQEKIVFWHNTKPEFYMNAIQEAVDRFNQAHPEISVEVQFPGSGAKYQEKITLAFTAGTAPDVLRLPIAVKYPMQYSGEKILAPMDELSENYAAELELEDVRPEVIEFHSYYGRLLGMPWIYQLEMAGLAYNKDLFRASGLDAENPPQSIEELVEYAKILTKDTDGDGTPDQWGYGLPFGNKNWITTPFAADLWRWGADIYDEESDKVLINGAEAVEALQFWVDCQTKYGISDPFAPDLTPMTQLYQYFASGKIGMIPVSPDVSPYSFDFDWAVVPYPYVNPELKVASFNSQPLAIFEQTSKKKAAYEFLRWITSSEENPRVITEIGEFPFRISTLATPIWKEFVRTNPAIKAFAEIVENPEYRFRHRPRTAIVGELKKIQKNAIQLAVYGEATAKEALEQAALEYEQAITKAKEQGSWKEPDWTNTGS